MPRHVPKTVREYGRMHLAERLLETVGSASSPDGAPMRTR